MKVYRYLSEKELKFIQNGEVDKIGKEYNHKSRFEKINTHNYKKGVKYLHFFLSSKDIKRVQRFDFYNMENYYICEFDIPLFKVLPLIRVGFYDTSGYKFDIDRVYEIAMPASKMKSKYLKSFRLDESHNGSEIYGFKAHEHDPKLYDFSSDQEYFSSVGTKSGNCQKLNKKQEVEECEPGQ